MNQARRMDLFSEIVMVLLGLLLILLAATQHFRPPSGLALWIGLGAILVLWGGRGFKRANRFARAAAMIERVRGASLVLVGAAMLAMIRMPFSRVPAILVLIGAILALRGLACAALAAADGAWPPGSKRPAPR
jgi:hypothetical protein